MPLKYEEQQYQWVVAGLRDMNDIDWTASQSRRAVVFDGVHPEGNRKYRDIVFCSTHQQVTKLIENSLGGRGPRIVSLMYPCVQRDAQTPGGKHEGQYFMNEPIWKRLNSEHPELVEKAWRRDKENKLRGIKAVEVEK